MQREFSCGVLRAPVLRRAASERGDVNADEYCGEKEGVAFLGLKLRRERDARAPRGNSGAASGNAVINERAAGPSVQRRLLSQQSLRVRLARVLRERRQTARHGRNPD